MAEIFGVAAGSIAVSTTLIKVCREIHRALKVVQHARGDISQLTDEGVIFAGLYDGFLDACGEELKNSKKISLAFERLTDWVATLKEDLSEILNQVRALSLRPKTRVPAREVAKAHIYWLFKGSAVETLRASLSVARENIHGLCLIANVRKLNNLLRYLMGAFSDQERRQLVEAKFGMKLEQKIEVVKQDISNKEVIYESARRMTDAARERLATAEQKNSKNSVSSPSDKLWSVTEIVDQCAASDSFLSTARTRTRSAASTSPRTYASTRTSTSPMTSTSASRSSGNQPFIVSEAITKRADFQITVKGQPKASFVQNAATNNAFHSRRRMPPDSTDSVKATISKSSRSRTLKIGRHNVSIYPGGIRFNNYACNDSTDNSFGKLFLQALVKQADELDDLDHAFEQYCGLSFEWEGFTGWTIYMESWEICDRQPTAENVPE